MANDGQPLLPPQPPTHTHTYTHTHRSQNERELKQILFLNLFWVMDLTENMKTRILSLEGKTSV